MFVVLQPGQTRQARRAGRWWRGRPRPLGLPGKLPVKILSVVDKKVRQESQPASQAVRVRPARAARNFIQIAISEGGLTHRQPAQPAESDINIISQWAGM